MKRSYYSRVGHGEQTLLHPLRGERVKQTSFLFGVDHAALQRSIDRSLNRPTFHDFSIRALATTKGKGLVSLLFFDGESCRSLHEPEAGELAWRQCGFFVPVAYRIPGRAEWQVAMWMPYGITDSSIMMDTQREIWGMSVEVGDVEEDAPHEWSVHATTFLHFHPEAEGKKRLLLALKRQPSGQDVEPSPFALRAGAGGGAGLCVEAGRPVAADELAALFGADDAAWGGRVPLPLLSLKQFPAVFGAHRAGYQALIYARHQIVERRAPTRIEGTFALQLTPCASHTIADDLGFANAASLTAIDAYHSEIDITFYQGKSLMERKPWKKPKQKQKIAILGGGISALSTAFYLSHTPELREQYELTVYQMGWRLGGKLASGRNQGHHCRNEEHGLHVWFGFYENAFRLLRDCYEEWQPPQKHPFPHWDGAFEPRHLTPIGDLAVRSSSSAPKDHCWHVRWPHGRQHPRHRDQQQPPFLGHLRGRPGDGHYSMTPWQSIMGASWMLMWTVYTTLFAPASFIGGDGRLESFLKEGTRLDKRDTDLYLEEIQGLPPEQFKQIKAELRPIFLEAPFISAELLATEPLTPETAIERNWSLPLAFFLWVLALERKRDKYEPRNHKGFVSLLEYFRDQCQARLGESFLQQPHSVTLRQFWLSLKLGTAFTRGLFDPRYGVWPRANLRALEHLRFSDWLVDNGLPPGDLKEPILRAFFEMGFMYDNDAQRRPNVAAGVAIQAWLRILNYREAIISVPKLGMGDSLITPLYDVLRERGVRFRFFHKVTRLELAEDQRTIEKIHFDQQMEPDGDKEYEPLIRVSNNRDAEFDAWPTEPKWTLLKDGIPFRNGLEEHHHLESQWFKYPTGFGPTKRVITHGKEFDAVVLGVSLGAFKPLHDEGTMCQELFDANHRFFEAARELKITPSLAVQLWMTRELKALNPSLDKLTDEEGKPALCGGHGPLSIWADMNRLHEYEAWPEALHCKSSHYLCGFFPSELVCEPPSRTDVPGIVHQEILHDVRAWFQSLAHTLWPGGDTDNTGSDGAAPPGSFAPVTWADLVAPGTISEVDRLEQQFLRANINPTDCCVAGAHNTSHYRLATDESGFDNLYLTSNWIESGFNCSSVETAVMAGKQCARAISGQKLRIFGEFFMMARDGKGAGCLPRGCMPEGCVPRGCRPPGPSRQPTWGRLRQRLQRRWRTLCRRWERT